MKRKIIYLWLIFTSISPCLMAQTELPDDFPVYQVTGDKDADDAAYDKAKKEWVEANPESYKAIGGQIDNKTAVDPDPTVMEEDCHSTPDLSVDIPQDARSFMLTDAFIIDTDSQLKPSEFNDQTAEFKEEMSSQNIEWRLSTDKVLYILSDGELQNYFLFERTEQEFKLFPASDELCSKETQTFIVSEWTEARINIDMPDQDEGSTLVYRLSLTN